MHGHEAIRLRLTRPNFSGAAHVVLPLLCGFMMYLLWRPTTLWLFVWLEHGGLGPLVAQLRASSAWLVDEIPMSLLLNVPAACWSYSFCFAIGLIWKSAPIKQWAVAMGLAVTIVLAGEALQVFPRVPGVFDQADLTANTIASAAAIALVSRFRTKI